MPEATDGAFLWIFFFSLFGRIVSELGLARRLPLIPAPPVPLTETCGMELTVSVSTVMFLVEPSPTEGFPRPVIVLYGLGGRAGDDRSDGVNATDVALIFVSPFGPPLSLPLSFAPFDLI